MRTLENVKQEIDQDRKFLARPNIYTTTTTRERNRVAKRIEENIVLLRYLQTNPSEAFVRREKTRIRKIIDSKNEQFNYWCSSVCPAEVLDKNRRSLFNKETGITLLRTQLKTIEKILAD